MMKGAKSQRKQKTVEMTGNNMAKRMVLHINKACNNRNQPSKRFRGATTQGLCTDRNEVFLLERVKELASQRII